MRAGQLTERVTIQHRKVTKGLSGGENYEWVDLFTARASVAFQSGTEGEQNMEYSHNQINKVTMYYRSAIKRDMRVIYNGESYGINSINSNRQKNMTILTIELLNE